MSTRAIERVDDWETRPFGGGYRGLHDLAEQEFSGVVRSPAGTLCMLNGNVVGILDGSIDDFEDADGTAYEAPTPALPLLILMQDRADEVRAKYYTEDTPLSKVDSTLSDGGFTGYIELSENVLSGDYYVVYQAGRSMSVAFVGNSGQLLSEDEAFERADDEVGIYKVRPVDIDPVEIPEPAGEPTTAGTATTSDATAGTAGEESAGGEDAEEPTDTGAAAQAESTESQPTEPASSERDETTTADTQARESTAAQEPSTAQATETRDETTTTDETGSRQHAEQTAASASGRGTAATERAPSDTDEREQGSTADPEEAETVQEPDASEAERNRQSTAEPSETVEEATGSQTGAEPVDKTDTEGRSRPEATSTDSADGTEEADGSAATDRRPEPTNTGRTEDRSTVSQSAGTSQPGTAADLETRTIPSLDPERSWSESQEAATSGTTGAGSVASSSRPQPEPSDDPRPHGDSKASSPEPARERTTESTTRTKATQKSERTGETAGTDSGSPSASSEQVHELEETIADREERIDDLEAQLESARQEREQLASERDELAVERDELIAERDDLQAELEQAREELATLREQRDSLQSQLEAADTDGVAAETRLSRQEAMAETDLFVRYNSKGEPTLKTAHDSGASRSDVNANLNVEYHTQFETDGAVVAGQPFDTFLRNTIEFRFVSWLVRQLLFEIRDTGHQNALSDLYDALPLIDRAELDGEASVEYTEDGQTKRSREAFDVVMRDRMGNPLVVANFNDTREAATEDDMRSLVTSATRVGESNETLAGAMFVTASFFEPEALETADESTGGGLLSRDKRESYVKVSRKQGYHLCLVEARDEQFHMAVPEL